MSDDTSVSSEIPLQYTVSANYIGFAPDLQMRVWLRAWLENANWDVSDTEKIQILKQETDRFQSTLSNGESK